MFPRRNRSEPLVKPMALGGNIPTLGSDGPKTSLDLKLTKQYFKLLQAIHHAEILAELQIKRSFPPGMMKQVVRLTAFIKPSSPNPTVLELVRENTDHWMDTNMCILVDHYDSVLAAGLQEVGRFDINCFDRAVAWARVRYRRKFTESSVATLQAMLPKANASEVVGPGKLTMEAFPPLSGVLSPAPSNVVGVGNGSGASGLVKGGVKNRLKRRNSRMPPSIPALELDLGPRGGKTISVMAETYSPKPQVLAGDQLTIGLAPGGVEIGKHTQVRQALVNGPERVLYSNVVVKCSNTIASLSDSGQEGPGVGGERDPCEVAIGNREGEEQMMISDDKTEFFLNTSLSEPPGRSQFTAAPVSPLPLSSGTSPLGRGKSKIVALISAAAYPGVSSSSSSIPVINLPVRRPGSISLEPVRHPNSTRKILEWELTIRKPIVIIGDSNISRIPGFTDSRVQADSFPGATFHHLKGVVEKLEQHPTVEKVVLSGGLNNCLLKQLALTSWKQLQQLLKVAESKFPNATLYVPIINYSDRLEKQQQSLLDQLNRKILEQCNYLPEISKLRFHTLPRDPVHWTPETGNTILNFWLDNLNM